MRSAIAVLAWFTTADVSTPTQSPPVIPKLGTTIWNDTGFNARVAFTYVEDFGMVVPVPEVLEEDQVRVLPAEVFARVERLAAPRLVEYWEQDPCPEPGSGSGFGTIGLYAHLVRRLVPGGRHGCGGAALRQQT